MAQSRRALGEIRRTIGWSRSGSNGSSKGRSGCSPQGSLEPSCVTIPVTSGTTGEPRRHSSSIVNTVCARCTSASGRQSSRVASDATIRIRSWVTFKSEATPKPSWKMSAAARPRIWESRSLVATTTEGCVSSANSRARSFPGGGPDRDTSAMSRRIARQPRRRTHNSRGWRRHTG